MTAARRNPAAQPAGQRDRWLLVAAAGLAVFMAQLDSTIVAVALPTIEAELGTPTALTQWVVLGYLLPLIALTLPSGRWLDRVGTRAALTHSVAGFVAASVLAGAAPGIGWLIAARVVQGAFAAVLFALLPVITTVAVRPQSRGRAMAVVTTLGPLGAVAGPVLGGFLVQGLGWPWIFYVNVPVGLAVIGIGLVQLPADGPLRLPERGWAGEALLLGGAAAAAVLALSLTASHGFGWLPLALVAVPLLAAWRRTASSTVVRELLRTPGMAGPHLALALTMAAGLLVGFLAPFYLQQVLETSPAGTGLTLLAFALAMAALGPLGGLLADRWGPRPTATTGAAILTAGLLLLVPLGQTWTPGDLAWRLAVLGAGTGLFGAPNLTMAMSRAPRHLLGTTGATTSLARQLGITFGPALATTVWALSGYALPGMRAAIALGAVLGALAVLTLSRLDRSARPDAPRPGRRARTRSSTPTAGSATRGRVTASPP